MDARYGLVGDDDVAMRRRTEHTPAVDIGRARTRVVGPLEARHGARRRGDGPGGCRVRGRGFTSSHRAPGQKDTESTTFCGETATEGDLGEWSDPRER